MEDLLWPVPGGPTGGGEGVIKAPKIREPWFWDIRWPWFWNTGTLEAEIRVSSWKGKGTQTVESED